MYLKPNNIIYKLTRQVASDKLNLMKTKLPKSLTTVTPLSKTIALALIVVLPFLGFYLGMRYTNLKNPTYNSVPTWPSQKACTQEAKLCPDGSYVGRSGPNCEFAACPVTKEGTFCGGIAGINCPLNYKCELDGNYPDAGGWCRRMDY